MHSVFNDAYILHTFPLCDLGQQLANYPIQVADVTRICLPFENRNAEICVSSDCDAHVDQNRTRFGVGRYFGLGAHRPSSG